MSCKKKKDLCANVCTYINNKKKEDWFISHLPTYTSYTFHIRKS